jgi:uncharacterized membrane protein
LSSKPYHKKRSGKVTKDSAEVTSFEGLTPDPDTLIKLEEVCPGITERWMTLAEEEIKNRQNNETRIVKIYGRSTYMGMSFAFLTSVVIASVGALALVLDYPKTAATIIVGAMAQVIISFLVRRNSKEDK